MPKFIVTKKVDAYVHYETLVEAENAEEARDLADAWNYPGRWVSPGIVDEFDHKDIFLEDVEETDETALIDHRTIVVDDQEHATILAALRYYQQSGMGEPINRSDAIHDIATNGDTVVSLDAEAIDKLCERIN